MGNKRGLPQQCDGRMGGTARQLFGAGRQNQRHAEPAYAADLGNSKHRPDRLRADSRGRASDPDPAHFWAAAGYYRPDRPTAPRANADYWERAHRSGGRYQPTAAARYADNWGRAAGAAPARAGHSPDHHSDRGGRAARPDPANQHDTADHNADNQRRAAGACGNPQRADADP